SQINKPNFSLQKDGQAISFSEETLFEVYDAYGNITKRGFSNTIDISNLPKGNYYLCYDNEVTDFKKKH
ncbi:MAG TPA: hypothetical protein VFF27_12025, partial [Bacteroidia bacterium]|nr:hypothetical protein [Bacteroidia bacterium]